MNQIHAKDIEDNNIAWNNRMEEAHASDVADREALQAQHQQELSKTMAALEYSRQERERDLRADLERRHSAAFEEAKNTEQQRINEAVEREARDWEQRMRELQTRMEVECRQHFDKGQAEGSAKATMEVSFTLYLFSLRIAYIYSSFGLSSNSPFIHLILIPQNYYYRSKALMPLRRMYWPRNEATPKRGSSEP